jgi:hypothetical protein
MRNTDSQNSNDSTLRDVIRMINAMNDRLRGLVSYTEYIATNLDTAVDYTEFIGNQITPRFTDSDLKRTEDNPGHRIPSFKKFQEMRRRQ